MITLPQTRSDEMNQSSRPLISVVLRCGNAVKDGWEATVRSLLAQSYPCLECVVVCNEPDEMNLPRVQPYAGFNLVSVTGRPDDPYDGLQSALRKASGDLLIFVRAGDVYLRGALNRLLMLRETHPQKMAWAGAVEMHSQPDGTITFFEWRQASAATVVDLAINGQIAALFSSWLIDKRMLAFLDGEKEIDGLTLPLVCWAKFTSHEGVAFCHQPITRVAVARADVEQQEQDRRVAQLVATLWNEDLREYAKLCLERGAEQKRQTWIASLTVGNVMEHIKDEDYLCAISLDEHLRHLYRRITRRLWGRKQTSVCHANSSPNQKSEIDLVRLGQKDSQDEAGVHIVESRHHSPMSGSKAFAVLFLGVEPYSEKMYPHLFDFLGLLSEHMSVCYTGDLARYHQWAELLWRVSPTWRNVRHFRRYLRALNRTKDFVRRQMQVRRALRNIIPEESFEIVIALDAVAWNLAASCVSKKQRLVFWSYHLPVPGLWETSFPFARWVINGRGRGRRACDLLVIQDPMRESVFRSIYKGYDAPVFHFPVSLRDWGYCQEVAVEKSRGCLGPGLCVGQITSTPGRAGDVLMRELQKPEYEDCRLLIHGFVNDDVLKLMRTVRRKPIWVGVQERMLDMWASLSRVDVGFVSYSYGDLAHKYMAYSSGQLVEFLRLGIPVIVLGNEDIGRLLEREGAGCLIREMAGLRGALDNIQARYGDYSLAARRLYETTYRLENYMPSFIAKLVSLVNTHSNNG